MSIESKLFQMPIESWAREVIQFDMEFKSGSWSLSSSGKDLKI